MKELLNRLLGRSINPELEAMKKQWKLEQAEAAKVDTKNLKSLADKFDAYINFHEWEELGFKEIEAARKAVPSDNKQLSK